MTSQSLLDSIPERQRLLLGLLAQGETLVSAAANVGTNKRAVLRLRRSDETFSKLYDEAWATGAEERDYRRWLSHPFRGKRPLRGLPSGVRPRYTYGRR